MAKNTTELTTEYINEHPHIRSCLKKGLINYSALSREIGKELKLEKSTSMEAILVAARRFQHKLKKEEGQEKEIHDLLAKAEMEIKNKIVVYILEKEIDFELINELQNLARIEGGTFFLLEGSSSYTIITQSKYSEQIEEKFKIHIIKENHDLAMINFRSGEEVEQVTGVISFITSLFSENGVNIVEILSCWTDNLFIIKAEDVSKVMGFLKF